MVKIKENLKELEKMVLVDSSANLPDQVEGDENCCEKCWYTIRNGCCPNNAQV